MHETVERLEKLVQDSRMKQDDALGEKVTMSKRLQETEAQLTTLEILNEGLRKDKNRVNWSLVNHCPHSACLPLVILEKTLE